MIPDLSSFTSAKIRTFVEERPYKSYGSPSDSVENLLLETVLQTNVFYERCHKYHRPPTESEFVDQYLRLTEREIRDKGVNQLDIAKRIARAWATYIMELDFYCQVRDAKFADSITIDTKLDARFGCDIKLLYHRSPWYLALYFETPAAKFWRAKKAVRKTGVPLTVIDFPLKEADAESFGNIHFYSFGHVIALQEILKGKTQKQLTLPIDH